MKNIVLPVLALILMADSQSSITAPLQKGPPFATSPVLHKIIPGLMDEASGIADSRANPGWLWVEQDSGNPPDLFLLSDDGKNHKKVHLKGLINRDWEDIAIGKGPRANTNYLYLADIGDNNAQYGVYFIYRFPEPAIGTDTVMAVEKISFRYPDGSHDAEAIIVDDQTKDIFIITKRDVKSKLYKLAYPQSASSPTTASMVGELTFNGVVSGAISPDAKQIILKTYTGLMYWQRKPGEAIEAALQKPGSALVNQVEPQGEAICFKKDNSGFLTLSEKPRWASFVNLQFYKRR